MWMNQGKSRRIWGQWVSQTRFELTLADYKQDSLQLMRSPSGSHCMKASRLAPSSLVYRYTGTRCHLLYSSTRKASKEFAGTHLLMWLICIRTSLPFTTDGDDNVGAKWYVSLSWLHHLCYRTWLFSRSACPSFPSHHIHFHVNCTPFIIEEIRRYTGRYISTRWLSGWSTKLQARMSWVRDLMNEFF
jgi:hypothetical protein